MAKIAVITGGNSGIGVPLSVLLAAEGYDLIMLNRSKSRSADAVRAVKQACPEAQVQVIETDLADHGSIKAAVEIIKESYNSVDLLVNNAGVLTDEKSFSPQGAELHFQVNAVTPYFLMKILRPLLKADNGSKVLNVGSSAMYLPPVGKLRVNELLDPPRMRNLFGAYAQSKMALVAFCEAIAADFLRDGIIVRVGEPGPNKTTMTAGTGMPKLLLFLRPLIFKPPSVGAKRLFDAIFDDKFGEQSGVYIEGGRVKKLPRSASDKANQHDLLQILERLAS